MVDTLGSGSSVFADVLVRVQFWALKRESRLRKRSALSFYVSGRTGEIRRERRVGEDERAWMLAEATTGGL